MKKNEIKTGTMLCEIPTANIAVLFKSGGLDFFIIDTEHGAFDLAALSTLIMTARLAKLPVLIRLPNNGRKDITRLLDMGADGLVLPMVNRPEDIAAVVTYAKYAPLGRRGISITRSHTFYSPPNLSDYMRQANEQTLLFGQIETGEGLSNLDGILATPGISGVIVGPNDLSCDLDCIGDSGPILSAIHTVAAAARRHDKLSGIITSDQTYLQEARKHGMELFCCGSELSMLKSACHDTVKRIQKLTI